MLVNVTLDLPEEVYNRYNEITENKNIAATLSKRLIAAADFNSQKGLYIDDDSRRTIEAALGYNISSAKQLAELVSKSADLSVGGVKVTLKQTLRDRLMSRCYDKRNFGDFVRDQVQQGLEVFVGLR